MNPTPFTLPDNLFLMLKHSDCNVVLAAGEKRQLKQAIRPFLQRKVKGAGNLTNQVAAYPVAESIAAQKQHFAVRNGYRRKLNRHILIRSERTAQHIFRGWVSS